jgi:NAD(P)-dependent dehydrogenase (short-subunit alcohol dehydrogenase family)
MEIEGTIAIVTGGASGMGAETANYLSKKGSQVAILDLDLEAAKTLAKRIKGLAVRCNVADEDEAEAALKQVEETMGTPQVLINCAGIVSAQRIVGKEGPMPLSEFQKVITVNLVGTFNMLRLTAARMAMGKPIGLDNERGIIINTASIAAYEGQIGQAAYSASKGGVCALTLPAARELARFNIRVMTIAPGLIHTPLLGDLSDKVQKDLATHIPYPLRLGRPLEFAHLAAHIIENPYLNGEVIRLDAGLRMQA